jgi:RNA polymerase sigma-70 factor (ECF subfamily)
MSAILHVFLEQERAIKRFLRRFSARSHDVDDLAQETFIRAFAAEKVQDVREPRAFLFRIAKNLALNEQAKWSNAKTDLLADFADSDVIPNEADTTPDDYVDARQRVRLLAAAVAALPPQCGRVFILRKVHGLSQKDIAEQLGISVSTVEKHIAAGHVKCSEYLRRHGQEVEGRFVRATTGSAREAAGPKTTRRLGGERRERIGDE